MWMLLYSHYIHEETGCVWGGGGAELLQQIRCMVSAELGTLPGSLHGGNWHCLGTERHLHREKEPSSPVIGVAVTRRSGDVGWVCFLIKQPSELPPQATCLQEKRL